MNIHNKKVVHIKLLIGTKYIEPYGGLCSVPIKRFTCMHKLDDLCQHHLERRSVHRNVATWQTSEVVGRAPKNCNSYPDAIFKRHH